MYYVDFVENKEHFAPQIDIMCSIVTQETNPRKIQSRWMSLGLVAFRSSSALPIMEMQMNQLIFWCRTPLSLTQE